MRSCATASVHSGQSCISEVNEGLALPAAARRIRIRLDAARRKTRTRGRRRLKPGKYTLSLAVTDPTGETSYVQRINSFARLVRRDRAIPRWKAFLAISVVFVINVTERIRGRSDALLILAEPITGSPS